MFPFPGLPTRRRLVLFPGLLIALTGCAPDPLPDQLGVVAFGVTCDPALAADFDRAVALLHHMTYPGARAAFQDIVARDPDCGMAYWGAAMTLFQPLWPTRPTDAELQEGHRLMQEAEARVAPGSREARFVAAGAAFFDSADDPDYWTRIARWAALTRRVYEADTDDLEAAAFAGLARLATSARSEHPAAEHAEAAAILAGILAKQPLHPGAIHYTIHADDFTGREREDLDVVRRYGRIAPRNPHALHMPTHIFVRLGDWEAVVDWNQRAADAALAQRAGPAGEYVWDEFPHAVEYLVYARLQLGDDDDARRLIQQLQDTPDLEPSFKTAFHLASTAARFALERQAWDDAAALQARQPDRLDWDRFPWPEAVVWHARGLGAAHRGDAPAVAASLQRLRLLGDRATTAGEALFASQIRILALEVEAWHAHEQGDPDRAVGLLTEALALEDRTPKHPVTPGATLPAGELLGDLYLALDDPAAARAAYTGSNDKIPGRLNTLLGLARSSVRLADSAAAADYYAEIVRRSVESSGRPGVEEARSFGKGG